MISLIELERALVAHLNVTCNIPIYTHVGEEMEEYPFIHVRDFSLSKWLLSPSGEEFKCNIMIYDSKPSNKSNIDIAEIIIKEICNLNIPGYTLILKHLEKLEVFQLKNRIWCACFELTLNIIKEI